MRHFVIDENGNRVPAQFTPPRWVIPVLIALQVEIIALVVYIALR